MNQETFFSLPRLSWLLALSLLLGISPQGASAQALSPAFTYQGELRAQGQPGNGSFDMEFRLYGAEVGGSQIGTEVVASGVNVVDGLFSVALNFGPGQFAGDRQWLELRIRASGAGSFETLSPRTELTAAPYAWSAAVALADSVTGLSIVDGSVGAAAINASQVQRRVAASCAAGQYLRAINADGSVLCGTESVGPAAWRLGGNDGTDADSDFIGTTDEQAFVIRTWNAPSLRIEPSSILFEGGPVTANAIMGSSANEISAGVLGGAISGGGLPDGYNYAGTPGVANRVTDDFGTVGGGFANRAGNDDAELRNASFATVGGGISNEAGGRSATIGGGAQNTATGIASVVAGGSLNSATGSTSAIAGGISNVATGLRSNVAGGESNAAVGAWSTVSGGLANCAGARFSWAGGKNAKVRPGENPGNSRCSVLSYPGGDGDAGSFAWADNQNIDFVSNGENQFLVRSQGSVQFTHDNTVGTSTGTWFRIRAPEGRSPLTVTSGTNVVLTTFPDGGVRIGNPGFLLPTPSANGLLVMGGARRNDNQSTWDTTSDARVKRDIVEIEGAVDTLLALRPTRFRYSEDFLARQGGEDREHLGFIAQELGEILPDSVSHTVAAEGDEQSDGLLQVNLSDVHVLTTAATRELAIQQRAMEAELMDLRGENAELRAELEALRELVLGLRGAR